MKKELNEKTNDNNNNNDWTDNDFYENLDEKQPLTVDLTKKIHNNDLAQKSITAEILTKTCGDCRYFSHFYVKSNSALRFTQNDNGYCKKKLNKNNFNCNVSACHRFEPLIFHTVNTIQISNIIKKMAKRLDEIAAYLRNVK